MHACAESEPPVERVEAFCEEVKEGERIEAVLERYREFDLQPGGVAPDPRERLADLTQAEDASTVSGVLAEPAGSRLGARPVCAIYYADRVLGGDDKVILAQFEPEWSERY